ncbi:F-box protein [Heracleum sosnowskyi]|uniref:F-box protein n=1 Tax=Heracleum sosnowskyi TaxID=360622 RepID=A0AAD8LVA8_9APIA|nr:F-box protein [Heracleum sosnowskyi]
MIVVMIMIQKGMIHMLKNLPLLEELELPYTRIFGKGVQIVGRCCPHLKKLVLDQKIYGYTNNPKCDKKALAIAKSMPGLRHLQLFGNRMATAGLMAILDNCHQQIKHVTLTEDWTEDYELHTDDGVVLMAVIVLLN